MEMCCSERETMEMWVVVRSNNGDVCCSERGTMEMCVVVRERQWKCML